MIGKSGNEAYIEVKEEITIDEHNLTEYEQLDLRPDDTSMSLTSLQLNEHLLTHAEERPHACDVCHQKFKEKSNLVRLRYQLKTKIKEKISTDATDVFESEQVKLKAATKSKANGLCCKICCKPCRDLLLLNEHLLTHSQERPFECDLCKLKFRRKLELQLHRKKHAKETRFQTANSAKLYCNIKEEITIEDHDILQMVKLEKDAEDELVETNQLNGKIHSQTFVPVSTLKYHLIAHSNQQQLKIHQNSHTKANQYECQIQVLYDGIKQEVTIEEHDVPDLVKLESKPFEMFELEPMEKLKTNQKANASTNLHKYITSVVAVYVFWQQADIGRSYNLEIKDELDIDEFDIPDFVNIKEIGDIGEDMGRKSNNDNDFASTLSADTYPSQYIISEENTKNFECIVCHKLYKSQTTLRRHQNIHTKAKDCHVGKIQQFFDELKGEVKIEDHDLAELVKLEREANYIDKLKDPKSVLVEEKLCRCEICHKTFVSANTLKHHLIVHSSERPFKCDICDLTFKRKAYLNIHRNKHTKQRQYRINGSSELLVDVKQEIKIEELDWVQEVKVEVESDDQSVCQDDLLKTFKCSVCSKTFARVKQLKAHLIIHSEERPFECEFCDRKFKQKRALSSHRNRHTKETQCQINNGPELLVNIKEEITIEEHHLLEELTIFICRCQKNNSSKLLVDIKEEIIIEEYHLSEMVKIEMDTDDETIQQNTLLNASPSSFKYQIKDSIELLVDIKEEMIIEEYQLNEMVKSEMNTDDETIHQNTVLNSPPASFNRPFEGAPF
uniref:C2H2-type domain-containing protein n=1 Tax=Dendroctonus ponderosae TaxID=77166 RepID=A0AAR5PHW7_DENPD